MNLKNHWRSALACAALGWLAAMPAAGQADRFPEPGKPVSIMVGFAGGAAGDTFARLLADEARKDLNHPVIVENLAGANGLLATKQIARAPADGHKLMLAFSVIVTNQLLYKDAGYDPFKDFTYVSALANLPFVLITHEDVPARNLQEFISLAQSRKDKPLVYASAGLGSTHALAMDLLKQKTGITMTHIPYKGAAPALLDLAAKRVDAMFITLPSAMPYIKQGKFRALAVAQRERNDQLPEVPTVMEAGVPDFEVGVWYGIVAPAGTPKRVVDRLSHTFAKAADTPAVRKFIQAQGGYMLRETSPEAFERLARRELSTWKNIIKDAQLKLE